MCGIVGIVGKTPVAPQIVEALKRLEYRGYDSAGVATLEEGRLDRRRAEGKLRNLETKLSQAPLSGVIGIGHTRWATHGKPNETNAHPHATDKLAVVHNGIIENFRELKTGLEAKGVRFETETDTEVVAQLVTYEIRQGRLPIEAVAVTLPRLRGAFALGFLFSGEEDLLIGARHGAPLAIGYGDGEMYLGSDALALAPFTDEVAYLGEGRLPGRWRLGDPDPQGRGYPGRERQAGAAGSSQDPGRVLSGRQGQLPPLHGQGDPRAGGSRGPHARPLRELHIRTS
jgi:glucosamine--fructose-6-phosphate aminotransferase (isomerizing)